MKKISTMIAAASLLGQAVQPAFAQHTRSYSGPRGRTAETYSGPRGQAAQVQGPHGTTSAARGNYGGAAVRGPYGGEAARGPYGGEAARGPYGGTAARGPYGGTAYRGPYGGTAARGPYGNVYARNSYAYGGRTYYRPGWNTSQINVYSRGFYGYPGWHSYGYYGLAPGLAAFTGLAFLSAGLLVGSYAQQQKTVYVYVVNEGGQNWEYRVDSNGNVISKRPVSGVG